MKHPSFDYVLAGLFLAAALVLPVFFHALGLGSAFMPMFYPLALAGFLVAAPLAMITGVSAPLLSALLTGMPPFYPPIAFIMTAEGLLFYRPAARSEEMVATAGMVNCAHYSAVRPGIAVPDGPVHG